MSEWQTMRTQNPLVATPCGFKSHHRHHVGMDYAPFKKPSQLAGLFSYRSVIPPSPRETLLAQISPGALPPEGRPKTSVISLATSFYVSHKSSSRAHSAAPRFKIATISLGCDFVFPMAKAILSFEIVTASHGFVRERSRRKRSPLGAKKRRRKR